MDRRVMHSLSAATDALRTAWREALAELGLTPVQNTTLYLVANNRGSSPAELSRLMHVTPQTMHKLLTDLEDRELLTLTPRQGHGRILDTNLTSHGQRLLADADARLQEIEKRLTAVLSHQQRQQLVTLLYHCVQALASETEGDRPGSTREMQQDDHGLPAAKRTFKHAP